MLNECLMGESREKAGRKQGESWERAGRKDEYMRVKSSNFFFTALFFQNATAEFRIEFRCAFNTNGFQAVNYFIHSNHLKTLVVVNSITEKYI
jgi:hypothetical protein